MNVPFFIIFIRWQEVLKPKLREQKHWASTLSKKKLNFKARIISSFVSSVFFGVKRSQITKMLSCTTLYSSVIFGEIKPEARTQLHSSLTQQLYWGISSWTRQRASLHRNLRWRWQGCAELRVQCSSGSGSALQNLPGPAQRSGSSGVCCPAKKMTSVIEKKINVDYLIKHVIKHNQT